MIDDVINTIEQNISSLRPENCVDIRNAKQQIVIFSEQMSNKVETIRSFLVERMYRHNKVREMSANANAVVLFLFNLLLTDQEVCAAEGLESLISDNNHHRTVCDFIAGMTDNFAQSMYNKYS
jgi:dGTPase